MNRAFLISEKAEPRQLIISEISPSLFSEKEIILKAVHNLFIPQQKTYIVEIEKEK